MKTTEDGSIGFSLDSLGDIADDGQKWTFPRDEETEGTHDDLQVLTVWKRNDWGGYSIHLIYTLEGVVTALAAHYRYGASLHAGEFAQALEDWIAGLREDTDAEPIPAATE